MEDSCSRYLRVAADQQAQVYYETASARYGEVLSHRRYVNCDAGPPTHDDTQAIQAPTLFLPSSVFHKSSSLFGRAKTTFLPTLTQTTCSQRKETINSCGQTWLKPACSLVTLRWRRDRGSGKDGGLLRRHIQLSIFLNCPQVPCSSDRLEKWPVWSSKRYLCRDSTAARVTIPVRVFPALHHLALPPLW